MSIEKTKRLYEFIAEIHQQRHPVIKDVKEYLFQIDFDDLPAHQDIQKLDNDSMDFLKVYRVHLTSCPNPSENIKNWITEDWENPLNEVDYLISLRRAKDRQIIDEKFTDDENRISIYNDWKQERAIWAREEQKTRKAKELYDKLFELKNTLERESGAYELLIGDGFLNWDYQNVKISHPILIHSVEIEFKSDEQRPYFILSCTDKASQFYSDALLNTSFDQSRVRIWKDRLTNSTVSPLGGEETSLFLKSFIEREFSDGEFCKRTHSDLLAHPRIWRSRILFLRRIAGGIIGKCKEIIEDLENSGIVPPTLERIVSNNTITAPVNHIEGNANNNETAFNFTDEPLFAKPSNKEQRDIAQRLQHSAAVLVQGPPGTGKTHTIANLVGHFLSKGNSILITSQTTKALSVLRNKLPESLQALCVSLAVSDKQRKKELGDSISAISEKVGINTEEYVLRVAKLEEDYRLINKRLHTEKLRRKEALSFEYKYLECGSERVSPSDAARFVRKHCQDHRFIPVPVEKHADFPLSDNEIKQLHQLGEKFSKLEEKDVLENLIPLDELKIGINAFSNAVNSFEKLAQSLNDTQARLWRTDHAISKQELTETYKKLEDVFNQHNNSRKWQISATVAGIQRNANGWEELARLITQSNMSADSYSGYAYFEPIISSNIPFLEQLNILEEIIGRYDSGGVIGLLDKLTKPRWTSFVSQTKVLESGRRVSPSRIEHFEAIISFVKLQEFRENLRRQYDFMMTPNGEESFESLGQNPEQSCVRLRKEIEYCLKWHNREWEPLAQRMHACGFDVKKALDTANFTHTLTEYERLFQFARNIAMPSFADRIKRVELSNQKKQFENFAIKVETLLANYSRDNWQFGFVQAIKEKDIDRYSTNYRRLQRLWSIRNDVLKREELIQKISYVASSWAKAVKDRVAPFNHFIDPQKLKIAWKWTILNSELNARDNTDIAALQSSIASLESNLRLVTERLIEAKAWSKQVKLLKQNESLYMNFSAWVELKKSLPTTRTTANMLIYDSKVREIKELSAKCQQAIPVWIMPLSSVTESLSVKQKFDLIIIDEASQVGLSGLIAMYFGKKVLIVGDDEQITPDMVGQELNAIHSTIQQKLYDFTFSSLFDSKVSLYKLAKVYISNTQIMLKEHFRCVPEIIAFSNNLSYDGKIKPLREESDSVLKPAWIQLKVDGVARTKKNELEAKKIVDLIRAMIAHPLYKNKTIGVIALVGNEREQVGLIQTLINRHIDEQERENRKILCGAPPNFQGDERDVMFLSVVDSPKVDSEGPIRLVGDGANDMWKKRYNVAASRAKDQVWVIHSLDSRIDLKPDDLRKMLIEHRYDSSQGGACDSHFEEKVLGMLQRRGYQVTCQYPAGSYKIDLVVGSKTNRLAIECDGDRYHTIDNLEQDLERQGALERCGWRFMRIRGTEFFKAPNKAMAPIYEKLDELGIKPNAAQENNVTNIRFELERWIEENPLED